MESHGWPMDCPRTARGVPFECLWRMIVRLWRLLFTANALQAHLALQFGCKFSSNCSASAQKGKIREIFVDVCCPWNPQNRTLAYTGARFSSFSMLPFITCPKLPKCVRKTSQERFGSLLGALWGSPGRPWGALGTLLGSSWAGKVVKKIEKASKIAENVKKY